MIDLLRAFSHDLRRLGIGHSFIIKQIQHLAIIGAELVHAFPQDAASLPGLEHFLHQDPAFRLVFQSFKAEITAAAMLPRIPQRKIPRGLIQIWLESIWDQPRPGVNHA